jgi:hypothetical protein
MNIKFFFKIATIFAVIIFANLSLFSQVTLSQVGSPSETFIKLKNDSIITGKSLSFKEGLFGKLKLITLDGKNFNPKDVSFYGFVNGGIYAGKLHFTKSFASYGKLNFYETTSSSRNTNGSYSSSRHNFYSVGIVKVKKLNTKNLSKDLVMVNIDVYNQLRKARGMRRASLVAFGIMGASLIAPVITESSIPYYTFNAGLLSGILFSIVKRQEFRKAVVMYTNGNYDPYKKQNNW